MPLKKIYIFKFVHFKVHTPVRKLFNHTIFSSTARKTEYDIKNNKVDQANLNEYLLFVWMDKWNILRECLILRENYNGIIFLRGESFDEISLKL